MSACEKARRQFPLKGVLWALIVLGAFLWLLSFRPLYRDDDPIPFTWNALEWHKGAVVIPWLVMAAGYVRYRLFAATAVHTFLVAIDVLRWGMIVAMGWYPGGWLDHAYQVINYDSQCCVFAAYFSLPLGALGTLGLLVSRFRPATESAKNHEPRESQEKPRSGPNLVSVLAVMLIVLQTLLVLQRGARPGAVLPGNMERLASRLKLEPQDADRPLAELIADEVPIEGRWQEKKTATLHWIDIAPTSEQGKYWVGIGVTTGMGPAILKRTGVLQHGELVLDRPAITPGRYLYCRLYVIRWQGQEMLLPSVNAQTFNECVETPSAAGEVHGWQWCVLVRKRGE